MKNRCDIVQDLIPLYVDHMLKESTEKLVTEHLHECADCKRFYKDVLVHHTAPIDSTDVKVQVKDDGELEFVKRLRSWKRNTSIIGVILILLVTLFSWYLGKAFYEEEEPVINLYGGEELHLEIDHSQYGGHV